MWHWTWRSFLDERASLAASAGGVAVVFLMVMIQEGAFQGEADQMVAFIERSGAAVWVMQDGVSNVHMAASALDEAVAARVRRVRGVAEVAGIVYSGGQAQIGRQERVLYLVGVRPGQRIGALINGAPILLADEPTGNLDSERGQEVVMILHDLARDDGRGVLVVTHDPRVEDVADRILWLEDGALRDRKQEPRDWVRDPVCQMRVDAASSLYAIERSPGERLVFCSRRCLERFNEDPARYS